VNSFDQGTMGHATQSLGSFNLFGVCVMEATLDLEHDPALATLVGTLRCMEHRGVPVKRRSPRRKSRSRSPSPKMGHGLHAACEEATGSPSLKSRHGLQLEREATAKESL